MPAEKLAAGSAFPRLVVRDLRGDAVDISSPRAPCDWCLVVVYRGRHCPMCTRYLNALQGHVEALFELGVDLVAVSADSEAQLAEHLGRLDVGFPLFHGLSIEQMQTLGVYISAPGSGQETDHPFAEPALFLIDDQRLLRYVNIANSPFLRPDPEYVLRGLRWTRNQDGDVPIRGRFEPD